MSSREASSLEYTYVALASDNATTSQEDQRRLRIAIVIDEDPVSKGMMGKQGTELGYVRKRTGTCLLLRRFQLLVAAVNVDSQVFLEYPARHSNTWKIEPQFHQGENTHMYVADFPISNTLCPNDDVESAFSLPMEVRTVGRPPTTLVF